jgi:hypothetical protein
LKFWVLKILCGGELVHISRMQYFFGIFFRTIWCFGTNIMKSKWYWHLSEQLQNLIEKICRKRRNRYHQQALTSIKGGKVKLVICAQISHEMMHQLFSTKWDVAQNYQPKKYCILEICTNSPPHNIFKTQFIYSGTGIFSKLNLFTVELGINKLLLHWEAQHLYWKAQ